MGDAIAIASETNEQERVTGQSVLRALWYTKKKAHLREQMSLMFNNFGDKEQ